MFFKNRSGGTMAGVGNTVINWQNNFLKNLELHKILPQCTKSKTLKIGNENKFISAFQRNMIESICESNCESMNEQIYELVRDSL